MFQPVKYLKNPWSQNNSKTYLQNPSIVQLQLGFFWSSLQGGDIWNMPKISTDFIPLANKQVPSNISNLVGIGQIFEKIWKILTIL